MSDRVFFATNETIGGFWPNISGFSGFPFPISGSGFPTSLSKAKQIELFWRVRIFDIYVVAGHPNALGSYGPFNLYAHDATYGIEPSSEKALCLHQSADWYGRNENDGMELIIDFGSDNTARFSLHVYGSTFVISDQGWSGGIHFVGDSAPGYGDPYDYFVQPSEYWPYANSVGDPIWNTATGAQINDPLG